MVAILTALGALFAAILPVMATVRWSRSARLRRKLEADLKLLESTKDAVAAAELVDLIRYETTELRSTEEQAIGLHPISILGVSFALVGTLLLAAGLWIQTDSGGREENLAQILVWSSVPFFWLAIGIGGARLWVFMKRQDVRYQRRRQHSSIAPRRLGSMAQSVGRNVRRSTPSPAPTTTPPPDES